MAKSNNRNYWIIGSIFLVAIIALSVYSRLKGPKGIIVETAKSEIRTLHARVTESGVVQPTVDVPVAPDVSGEVVNIAVQEGMKVKKGDLLLTIRPDDYRSVLEQANASLDRSRASHLQARAATAQSKATFLQDSVSYRRSDQLFNDKVISQADWEAARLKMNVSKAQFESASFSEQAAYYQVKSAESSLKQARQNLDRTNIYASMDGTITQLNVELGQRVVGTAQMAGTEILKIADLSSMEVVVDINENDVVNLHLGDSARIEVDALTGKSYYGKVTEIAYSAKGSGTSGAVSADQVTNFEVKVRISPASYAPTTGKSKEIKLAESPFRPGMTALVEIYTDRRPNAVSVPIQAVTMHKSNEADSVSQEVVFRVKNGIVEMVPVKTGISDDFFLEVLSGLKADEEIVIGPYNALTTRLTDGAAIEIEDKKEKVQKKP